MSSVVVTGAAKAIGAGIAEAFARAGWSVVAVDRDKAPREQTASRIGGTVVTLAGDVAQRATNEAAVKTAVDRFGGLDAAVGNAGVTLPKLIDETTPEEFDRLFSINVKALMYLAQAAHRALAKSKGSLTVIASKTGLVAQRNSPIYVATKGAAVQLARALPLDWADEGVPVNAVCPRVVGTPMLQEVIDALTDPAAAKRLADHAVSTHGRVDVLFNNAGISGVGTVHETTTDLWDRVMAVNVRGVFLVSKFVVPHMLERRAGSIINMSSTIAEIGLAQRASYAASKGAVLALTRAMQVDYASFGIRVNALLPGTIHTPFVEKYLRESYPNREDGLNQIRKRQLTSELGKPEDVASAALFLASDESSFVMGTGLFVDGGVRGGK